MNTESQYPGNGIDDVQAFQCTKEGEHREDPQYPQSTGAEQGSRCGIDSHAQTPQGTAGHLHKTAYPLKLSDHGYPGKACFHDGGIVRIGPFDVDVEQLLPEDGEQGA